MNFLIDEVGQLTSNCLTLAQEPGKEDAEWFEHDWYTQYRTGVQYTGVRTVTWADIEETNITAIYILEAKKTFEWWCGLHDDGPKGNLISSLPEKVLNAIRNKKIFLSILADMDYFPCEVNSTHLKSIHDAMIEMKLPAGSVFIGTNDPKFEDEYEKHVKQHGRYFIMHYTNTVDDFTNAPSTPSVEKAIKVSYSRDFNSLNKEAVHRPHTAYHLFQVLKSNFLKRGFVSLRNFEEDHIIDMQEYITDGKHGIEIFEKGFPKYFPRLADSPDHTTEFETTVPMEVYSTSLMTVVCETTDKKVGFFGRKTMKPIIGGQPFIFFGCKGVLQQLRSLGYRTELCGIDTSYDSITDNAERHAAAAAELEKWIKLPRQDKITRIEDSLEDIRYNMNKVTLNKRSLDDMTKASRKYFK